MGIDFWHTTAWMDPVAYPALARARELMWVVTGADKGDALAALLAGSTETPAGRVTASQSLVLADEAAASR